MVDSGTIHETLQFAQYNDRPPVFTAKELAEELDVTRQTVLNKMEEVEEKPGVRSEMIGQAKVWWADTNSYTDDTSLERTIARNRRETWRELLRERATWLDNRQTLIEQMENGEDTFRTRLVMLHQLSHYFTLATSGSTIEHDGALFYELYESRDELYNTDSEELENIERPEETPDLDLTTLASDRFPEERIRYYLFDAPLFTTEGGEEIVGIAEFIITYDNEIQRGLRDEHGNITLEDVDPSDIGHQLPTEQSLIAGGDAIDRFVTKLFNIRW